MTPAAATQLAVTTQPAGAVAINTGFGLTISAEDPYGNVDPSFDGSVTVALGNNPGSGVLGGTTTMTAAQGIAAFAGLTINMPSTDDTLEATSNGVTSATTATFTVTPPATQLIVTSQPPTTPRSAPTSGLTITVQDASNDVVPSFDGDVTIALASGPPNGHLSGGLSVPAASGVASFTGLSLDAAGDYTILVTSSTLTAATTDDVNVTAGAIAQLATTTEPPLAQTAGVPFPVGVSVEDIYGNVESSFYGNINIGLVGSTVPLSGALTATANQGVATFSGLVIDSAGTGYSLQASEGTLTTTSSTMSVTPAPAIKLVVTNPPPGTMTAGSSFGLTVSAEDAFGNLATTYDDIASVALSSAPAGSTLAGPTAVTAAQGVATFAGLALDTVGAGDSLQITSGSLTAKVTGLNVTPGPAAELAVTTQPPATTTAGTAFGLMVSVDDAFGNLATTYSGSVTVALTPGPGRGTLGGPTTVTAVGGVAAFTGLVLDTASLNDTLELTATGLTATTTSTFSVTPGSATKLVVTIPPPGAVAAGSGFGLIVSAEDALGNLATSFSGSVSVALAAGAGRSVLSGVTTVTAIGGIAAFGGLSLNTAGAGYTLQATSSGLTSATSAALNVTPTAAQLIVMLQPPASVVAGTGFGLSVAVADASGTLVSSYNGSVTIALANDPVGGQLSGVLTVSAVNGVATFSGLSINVAASGYTLRATSGALAAAVTAPVAVNPGPVPHLAIFVGSGVVTTGSPFVITVDAEDASGATESGFSGYVTLSLGSDPTGATLGGALTLPVSDGQVTFYGLTLNAAGSGDTILATSSGFVAAITSPITVISPPAAPTGAVSAGPPSRIGANQTFGVTVEVVDASGNLASGYTAR